MVLLLGRTLTSFVSNLKIYSSILFYTDSINQSFKFCVIILLVP